MASRRTFVKALSLSGAATILPAESLFSFAGSSSAVRIENTVITPDDPRYDALIKGNNARFTAAPRAIHLCADDSGIVDALEAALNIDNRKITVRSGGHCYENFVCDNNGGILCDVSAMKQIQLEENGLYGIEAGCTIGDAYTQLYSKYGVTLPLGTCFSVGLGGHITGGGFGVVTRQLGLCVDYLQAVSLVYVDENEQVIARTFDLDKPGERDVVWAHQGGGGGNFGIITKFWFKDLPEAPGPVKTIGLSWDWEKLSYDAFRDLVRAFSLFQEEHRAPGTPFSNLYTSMGLRHRSGGRLGVSAQYIGDQPEILEVFIDHMQSKVRVQPSCYAADGSEKTSNFASCIQTTPWFDLTLRQAGGGDRTTRMKYKSTYMKRAFPDRQIKVLYRFLSEDPPPEANWFTLLLDAYGGEVNRIAADATAIPQRDSAFKLQYILGWKSEEQDKVSIEWLQRFYREMHADTGGEPMPNDVQDGCYVNYCDVDLKNWQYLYYKENYLKLQKVKTRLDPHNIFYHAQSIEPG